MLTVSIDPTFAAWREAARAALSQGISPDDLLWENGGEDRGLFANQALDLTAPPKPGLAPPKISKAFFDLANLVACHSDPERWALLYRIAWRLTHGGERSLLKIETDDDVRRAENLAKSVRRDRHKMTAFVRFRKTGEHPESGREQFVAWFEPDHHIVELTAPFFQKRFTSMDWSILTPERCAHWDGKALTFTEGIPKSEAPDDEDALDDYWRTYYAHIFNPARLKLKAMQAEMPKKYWKNLPEAPLIEQLTRDAALRTGGMIDSGVNEDRSHVMEKVPKGVPAFPQIRSVVPKDALAQVQTIEDRDKAWQFLEDAASGCRACPLHERATQTVFGTGPRDARLMLIGEQPGDREDLEGRPFVGPAGAVLDEALQEAGLVRDDLYLTNAVKHFKWKPKPGSKQRLHQNPSANESWACRPWLLGEILTVQPETLVLLGATAAKSLLGADFRLTQQRGLVESHDLPARVIATFHPSYFLRNPDAAQVRKDRANFVEDLVRSREPNSP